MTQFEPEAGHGLDVLVSNFATMGMDALATTRAIKEPILLNDNIRNAYDSITYSKSQAIIHMVDSYFGAENFRRAMGNYVAQFADSVANSNQFYQSIAKQTGEPALTSTFKQFAEQKGVPLIGVKIKCDPAKAKNAYVSFTQSRYKPLGSLISENPIWTVPMCVSYGDESQSFKSCALISQSNNQLELETNQCPTWFMPNAGGNGYYRWLSSLADLDTLFTRYPQLNNGEKIAFLDHVFSGFEAGNIKLKTLLAAVKLSTESELRQIVDMPINNLSYYLDDIFDDKQSTEVIAEITPWYLLKLEELNDIENIAKKTSSSLSDNQQLLKNQLIKFLASNLKHANTRTELISLAENYLKHKGDQSKQQLTSDLYTTAFTITIQELGNDFFKLLIKSRDEIDDPLFDSASASALGAVKDPLLIDEIQNYVLSDKIGSRESFTMIYSMLSEKPLQEIHWSWFKQNLSSILKKIPAQWRRSSPRFASVFCDTNKTSDIDDLFQTYAKEAPGFELALAQTKEKIALCYALKESI